MSDTKEPREAPWRFMVGSHEIVVDYKMLPILAQFTWYVKPSRSTFYAVTNVRIRGKQTPLAMHRLLTGLRAGIVDHKNRNGLDNRMENLRFATPTQNSMNRVRKNSLGYRGVYKAENSQYFCCQIQREGKKYHESGFRTPEDAARRYDELSKELHGEFGIRNFER